MFRHVHLKRRFNGTSIEVALSSGSGQDLSQEGHSQQGGHVESPSVYCRFACLGIVTAAEEANGKEKGPKQDSVSNGFASM